MDPKVLRELLGLPADADDATVTAKLTEVKTAGEKALTDNTEVRELRDRVATMERADLERSATSAVNDAISGGKFLPAQRDQLTKYALSDLDGFKALAEATPKIAALSGPLGHDSNPGDNPEESKEPTAAELAVAKQVGVSMASLAESKGRTTADLIEKAHAPAGAR